MILLLDFNQGLSLPGPDHRNMDPDNRHLHCHRCAKCESGRTCSPPHRNGCRRVWLGLRSKWRVSSLLRFLQIYHFFHSEARSIQQETLGLDFSLQYFTPAMKLFGTDSSRSHCSVHWSEEQSELWLTSSPLLRTGRIMLHLLKIETMLACKIVVFFYSINLLLFLQIVI